MKRGQALMRNAWLLSAFFSLICAGVLCAQTPSGPAQITPAAILVRLDTTSAQILYHDNNDHVHILDFVLTTTTLIANVKDQDTVRVSYIDNGPKHVAQSIEIYPAQVHPGHQTNPGGEGGTAKSTEPPAYSREGEKAIELAEAQEAARKGEEAQASEAANARPGAKINDNPASSVTAEMADEIIKRMNSLASTMNGLDAYKPVADVSLTFKFDKWDLTKEDKLALDDFAKQLETTKGYYLQVIGGGHGTGAAEHDDGLSYLRANAVVEYLGSKYGVAPHHFF